MSSEKCLPVVGVENCEVDSSAAKSFEVYFVGKPLLLFPSSYCAKILL